MGSQQLLMLIIGVIVVGIAIVVGIMVFSNGAYNANKSAIAQELQKFSTGTTQFWMMPTSMGGANQSIVNVIDSRVGSSLGFIDVGGVYTITNENGEFRMLSVSDGVVVIGALGNVSRSSKFPYAEITIDLLTKSAETTVGEAEGF